MSERESRSLKTGADESSVLEESAEVDEPAKPVADFEQIAGFQEDLRPPHPKADS